MRFKKRQISFLIITLFALGILLSLSSCTKSVKDNNIISERTKAENRAEFKSDLVSKTILGNLKKELSKETEEDWQAAFWASEFILFRDEFLKEKLKAAFAYSDKGSIGFQRALIENVYTLFPNQFNDEVREIMNSTDNSKIFAMCVKYLEKSSEQDELLSLMNSKFPEWLNDPILFMLNDDLRNKEIVNPPIVDLLTNNFGDDTFVIFSFQRKDRDYKGVVIIKDQSGNFVKEEDGSLFSIPQFARAITNLPPYITNGNTPQGVFSFQGFDVSSNESIGPTTNIQLVMPFEVSPQKYFAESNISNEWNNDLYKNLLPQTWKEYLPIFEAFYAGKAGRNEIISHGTTIDSEYYKTEIYYPYTPSLGCLTAHEVWSAETGERIESNQQRLVDKLKSINASKGYFVLVELDNQKRDVTTADILSDILKAQK